MFKVRFLKSLDQTLGPLFVRFFAPPPKPVVNSYGRFLVIRPGGIGDAALLAPALLAIQSAYPSADLDVLAERRNAGVFPLIPGIRRTLRYDVPRELLAALRGGYDLVIDTEQWHRLSAIVTRFAGAPRTIGFATNERERLFTDPVAYSHDWYEAEAFCRLLEPLGIALCPVDPPFLTVPPAATAKAQELLGPLAGQPFAVLYPGASIPERRWGTAKFRQVGEGLRSQGIVPVVVGGAEDGPAGEAIVAPDGLNLAGRTTLAETAAVIAGSRLLMGGDSGILHLAVGLGTPTVSFFGPGIEAKWGPRGFRHRVLNRHLACSPCTRFGTTPHCPHGARCMAEIEPEEVLAACWDLLAAASAGNMP